LQSPSGHTRVNGFIYLDVLVVGVVVLCARNHSQTVLGTRIKVKTRERHGVSELVERRKRNRKKRNERVNGNRRK